MDAETFVERLKNGWEEGKHNAESDPRPSGQLVGRCTRELAILGVAGSLVYTGADILGLPARRVASVAMVAGAVLLAPKFKEHIQNYLETRNPPLSSVMESFVHPDAHANSQN